MKQAELRRKTTIEQVINKRITKRGKAQRLGVSEL